MRLTLTLILTLALTLGVVLPLLSGCAGAPNPAGVAEGVVAAPKAEVVSARVTDQSDVAARVIVTVKLTNPNAVDLPLMRAGYTVRVGGERYSGSDVPHVVVPAKGAILVDLPGVVLVAGAVGQPYTASGSVTYMPPGEVRKLLTDYNVPLPTTGFSGEGVLAFGHEVPELEGFGLKALD